MKSWTPLKKGDRIDIIAPGYPVTGEELEAGCEALRAYGLIPRVPENLLQPDFVFSNNNITRAKHLYDALSVPDSSAVWCVRGGSGTARLLEALPATPPAKCKPVIGLSDITSLHLFLNTVWKWSSMHGAGLARIGTNPPETEETFKVLLGTQQRIVFSSLQPLNAAARQKKELKSTTCGGNLSIVATTIGTPWSIAGKEGFLFLEDIAERGYKIDRTLVHLRQAGVFQKTEAVIFGDFIGGKEPDGSTKVQHALNRFAEEMPIPVLQGIESGHGKLQRPLPFGTEATLRLTEGTGTLCCESGMLL